MRVFIHSKSPSRPSYQTTKYFCPVQATAGLPLRNTELREIGKEFKIDPSVPEIFAPNIPDEIPDVPTPQTAKKLVPSDATAGDVPGPGEMRSEAWKLGLELLSLRAPKIELDPSTESVRLSVHNARRSEEHTSELQSRLHLVCR